MTQIPQHQFYEQVNSLHITDSNIEEIRTVLNIYDSDNIKQLYVNNNNLSQLCELPVSLTKLNCANNKLTRMPDLPITLRQLYMYGNQIKTFYNLPPYLEFMYIDIYENTVIESLPETLCGFHYQPRPKHDVYRKSFIENQRFETKKELVKLLKKANFRHNLIESDIEALNAFREKQKNVAKFYRISMPHKNYHELCIDNRKNIALRAFGIMCVSYKIVEYL
jgi:Leucine-rich repeat (LRR) protein